MGFVYGEGCWVFVCNPAKWHVDDFLRSGERTDSWALDDRYLQVLPKPGDFALIRVGNDVRSKVRRKGHPRLVEGIYALCEITSGVYRGQGVSSRHWHGGDVDPHAPEQTYSTVDWQLVTSYLTSPITVECISAELPTVQSQIINQPQARSYPLSRADFWALLDLGGMNEDDVVRELFHAPGDLGLVSPQRRLVQQSRWERGPEGRIAKKANGYRCQLCMALERESISFHKPDGEPYVEAHHVVPVSSGRAGTLDPSNIITVCANHHRQLHYGGVPEPEELTDGLLFRLPEGIVKICKATRASKPIAATTTARD
ncbi:MAG: HNH endonuclease [Rhodospirillaceae bacterium]